MRGLAEQLQLRALAFEAEVREVEKDTIPSMGSGPVCPGEGEGCLEAEAPLSLAAKESQAGQAHHTGDKVVQDAEQQGAEKGDMEVDQGPVNLPV